MSLSVMEGASGGSEHDAPVPMVVVGTVARVVVGVEEVAYLLAGAVTAESTAAAPVSTPRTTMVAHEARLPCASTRSFLSAEMGPICWTPSPVQSFQADSVIMYRCAGLDVHRPDRRARPAVPRQSRAPGPRVSSVTTGPSRLPLRRLPVGLDRPSCSPTETPDAGCGPVLPDPHPEGSLEPTPDSDSETPFRGRRNGIRIMLPLSAGPLQDGLDCRGVPLTSSVSGADPLHVQSVGDLS